MSFLTDPLILGLLMLALQLPQGVTNTHEHLALLIFFFRAPGLWSAFKIVAHKTWTKCSAVTSQASQALTPITHTFSPLLPSESLSLAAGFIVPMPSSGNSFYTEVIVATFSKRLKK